MEKLTLQRLLEELDYETRSYSSRGMFGKTCLAVDLNRDESPYVLIGKIMKELIYDAINQTEDGKVDVRDIIRTIENTKEDSMGLGIVLYWPSVPYKEND